MHGKLICRIVVDAVQKLEEKLGNEVEVIIGSKKYPNR